jgi:plastocyanin
MYSLPFQIRSFLVLVAVAVAALIAACGQETERVVVSPMLAEDEAWSFIFEEEGTYEIRCRPHPRMKQTVRVGPGNGSGEAASLEIRSNAFRPGTIEIERGTTVTWTNRDRGMHDVDVRIVR